MNHLKKFESDPQYDLSKNRRSSHLNLPFVQKIKEELSGNRYYETLEDGNLDLDDHS
jgi:hypothetical protein